MRITLQGTGHPPVEVEYDLSYSSTQMLSGDKRGVRLSLFSRPDYHVAELVYLTQWGIEREFTRLFQSPKLTAPGDYLPPIDEFIRNAAKDILPPGAGYPATPQFETRQSKLQGMLETLTLVALSDVLKQVAE